MIRQPDPEAALNRFIAPRPSEAGQADAEICYTHNGMVQKCEAGWSEDLDLDDAYADAMLYAWIDDITSTENDAENYGPGDYGVIVMQRGTGDILATSTRVRLT